MADDPSTIAWRLAQLENAVRALDQRIVSADLYARDRAEIERDIADLRAALAEEKLARRDADKELRDAADRQGTNWRQAIYAGVIPGVIFLVGILLQLRAGTGK